MPYTKQYNLCSVPYSLAQPLFGFNCQAIFRQMQTDASSTDGQADSQPCRRDPLTGQ